MFIDIDVDNICVHKYRLLKCHIVACGCPRFVFPVRERTK